MTKYTINKVFHKTFPSNIWKIEVDSEASQIAVETRDVDTTMAEFHVFDFDGYNQMSPCKADGKEWTLDSIQKGHLILKKIGEHTPIQEGIQIIRIEDNKIVFNSYEYILLDVYQDIIHARHRSITSGETITINLFSGEYTRAIDKRFKFALNKIQFPIPYPEIPELLKSEVIIEPLWLSKCGQNYLWCYHQPIEDKFNLNFTLSNLNHILESKVILQGMDKMIPQPYFQIEHQMFFMSFNKREIISYLV